LDSQPMHAPLPNLPHWHLFMATISLMLLMPGPACASQEQADETEIVATETTEPYDAGWEFYFDNDVFFGSAKDRNYTGGVALTLAGGRAAEYPYSLNGLLERLDRFSGFQHLQRGSQNFERHAIEFGLTLFTPDDVIASQPVLDDHPYANLLFMANSRMVVDTQRQRIYQSSLLLGLLGTSVGEQVQKQIHRLTGSETPQGWDNQIADGGELTVKHSLSVHQMLLSHQGDFAYDILGGVEAGIGYTTDLRASLSARWGTINTPWWSFTPHQNEYINLGQTLSGKGQRQKHPPEFYLWGGVQVKYRLYNALLQGQFRDSEVTFDRDELESVILSARLGVTKTFADGPGISLVMQAQSNEIDHHDLPNTVWGGLVVSMVY
jgi:hypothetical protein